MAGEVGMQAMKRIVQRFWSRARRLGDESGEIPVGGLLIIGLIVIPLVIALIVFRAEVYTWFVMQWINVREPGQGITFGSG
jgi:hypothetical protein